MGGFSDTHIWALSWGLFGYTDLLFGYTDLLFGYTDLLFGYTELV